MVNLLWSNPLPQPQFASLSILLQLGIPPKYSENDYVDTDGVGDKIIPNISSEEIMALANDNDREIQTVFVPSGTNATKEVPLYPRGLVVNYLQRKSSSDDVDDVTMMPATIIDVHYDDVLEPYYTIRLHHNGVEKQTDNAHIRGRFDAHDNNNNNSKQQEQRTKKSPSSNIEADKSAGPPTTLQKKDAVVLRETITIITPNTLLSEKSHMECMDELHWNIMETFGLRDDFLGVVGKGGGKRGDDTTINVERDEKNDDGKAAEEDNDDGLLDDNSFATPVMMPNNNYSRVKFHNGTKEGRKATATSTSGVSEISSYFHNLPVRVYTPNNNNDCCLGMSLYYLAVYVEDITKLLTERDGGDDVDVNDPVMELFRHCASVLVPGIALASSNEHPSGGGGVIALTVGSTGPPYDLFGASSVIATLPQRLREGMYQLALIDTTPKKQELSSINGSNIIAYGGLHRQQELLQQPAEKDSRIFSFLGKSSSTATTHRSLQQQKLLHQLSQSTTTTSYDSAYYKRLYMALLATILDDEEGYMRDHDDDNNVTMMNMGLSNPFSPASTVGSLMSPRSPSSQNQNTMTTSGNVVKRNSRFTFSRRKVDAEQDYAFGNDDDGGGERRILDGKAVSDGRTTVHPSMNIAADIVRRAAQKLEVLSIAEEEMPIPRYSHKDENNNAGGSPPKSRKSARIMPSGAAASSGRFGRPAVPSDLAGFDYRPLVQQSVVGGGGGMSATTATTESTEDASISGFSVGSQSPVPTLSRSKRDDTSTVSSSNRSRRFMFLKKKKEEKSSSPPRKGAKPQPLSVIPQDQEFQSVYDPFGTDDDYYVDNSSSNNNHATNVIAQKGVFQSLNSTTVQVKEEEEEVEDPPPTPKEVVDEYLKQSLSYESEGKESSYASVPESNASTAPESVAEPEPEVRRNLDVSLALNEDLTCEYKKSKLSTLTVEGTIQVRISTSYEGDAPQEVPPSIPFILSFKDHSGHVRTLQENKKFVENVSQETAVANREFTYTIAFPREEEYFPVLRYKCDTSLRPVPIRVQTRVRTQGMLCRVALQISSNPQNPSDLVHLTIIMGVPPGLKGETLKCNPPGGIWNESKHVVLWCVSELGRGEKFQLQAILEMSESLMQSGVDPAERLEFPIMARCQCSGAQLSDVALDVSNDDMFPGTISKNVIRRFRVSHREKK